MEDFSKATASAVTKELVAQTFDSALRAVNHRLEGRYTDKDFGKTKGEYEFYTEGFMRQTDLVLWSLKGWYGSFFRNASQHCGAL